MADKNDSVLGLNAAGQGQNLTFPQGTRDEIIEEGLKPNKVGSCSRPGKGNLGCEYYRSENFGECRFREWRDGYKGLKGPLNIGVRKILSQEEGGVHQEFEVSCHGWYKCGFAAQQQDMAKSGTVVQIIAYEGDGKTINERMTRPDTRKGAAPNQLETYIDTHEVRPFVRPKEKFRLQSMAQDALRAHMVASEADALRDALAKHEVKKDA